MADRRPIYSAKAAGQQIGYIEADEAFDLFDKPCAIYDSNTGLLRNPKNNAVVGYVSLADIFVGSSWMAQKLFFKIGPVTPQASLEELGDEDCNAAVCGAEDGDAENADGVRLIARAPDHAAKNDLSVEPTPVDSEKASVEEHTSPATDITTFASSSQQDKVVDSVLAPHTSPFLGNSPTEQPQDASDARKGFASGEPGLDYSSPTMGETAPTLQPGADAGATMLAPSDESTFASAQPDEPSGGDGTPLAVEAFMRYLTEYLHSSNHQTATLSSDDAADVKLSPSAETQKDMDQVPFPDEPDPEGGSSCSAQYSGPTGVDREQTENFSVRMESAVRIARDKHREGYSSAAGVAETNGAIRGIFLTEIDPSAEQPSVDTDIAELVTLMKRFALLSGDADLRPRVIGEAVSDSDNRLSADRSEVRVSLEAATPNNQLGHVVHDRMVAGSADGQGEPPRKTLSASYYRRRAEVLRIALITTRRPEAAVRLRAFIEKYRALADQAARYTHPSEGI